MEFATGFAGLTACAYFARARELRGWSHPGSVSIRPEPLLKGGFLWSRGSVVLVNIARRSEESAPQLRELATTIANFRRPLQ